MCWYNDNPERWLREQHVASEILTAFESNIDCNGNATFQGDLELCSAHGHVYETVRIRIVYPAMFPTRNRPPVVYLESHRNRWKPVPESHIESDWNLCLFVPGESGIVFAEDDSLKKLISVIHTFLLKERIYQRRLANAKLTGEREIAEWPGPDRSHGVAGIREAIRDMGRIGRNDPCPCGSGKKFKKCHLGEL